MVKRKAFLLLLLCLIITGCAPKQTRNEVIVMGMIHSGHNTNPRYSLEVLKAVVQAIDPDYILAEIPPDRYPIARKEFNEKDTITEPRVRVFPEYVGVIFPLTRSMDFEIIPTAGWTKAMNDYRRQRLRQIREDTAWADRWAIYQEAGKRAAEAMRAAGDPDDPYFINSEAYDSAAEIRYEVYNRLFNDELKEGGWDNINAKHYGYIEKMLNDHQYEGKRILITYGAGHKGWFLRKLKKRDDIILLEMRPFLDQVFNP